MNSPEAAVLEFTKKIGRKRYPLTHPSSTQVLTQTGFSSDFLPVLLLAGPLPKKRCQNWPTGIHLGPVSMEFYTPPLADPAQRSAGAYEAQFTLVRR